MGTTAPGPRPLTDRPGRLTPCDGDFDGVRRLRGYGGYGGYDRYGGYGSTADTAARRQRAGAAVESVVVPRLRSPTVPFS
ncbi:hypothetical protein ACFV5G_07800 [Streptomyces sp. NPDC059766]|uniref:hypothetical protein n=1 Tax=Streptomyces sp. NPDC059766 TaxID=3346940 RepID=UPI003659165B